MHPLFVTFAVLCHVCQKKKFIIACIIQCKVYFCEWGSDEIEKLQNTIDFSLIHPILSKYT